MKIIGAAIGKELALINPLLRCLSKYFYSTLSLFWDIYIEIQILAIFLL